MTALALLIGVLVGCYIGTRENWLWTTVRRLRRERDDAWRRLEGRLNCERCGVETGDYRMHPDPHVCVGVLEGVVEGLRAEVARLTGELGESVKLWLAEREAHAKTKAELAELGEAGGCNWPCVACGFGHSAACDKGYETELKARADRAEAVLRGLWAWLESDGDLYTPEVLAKLDALCREQGVEVSCG